MEEAAFVRGYDAGENQWDIQRIERDAIWPCKWMSIFLEYSSSAPSPFPQDLMPDPCELSCIGSCDPRTGNVIVAAGRSLGQVLQIVATLIERKIRFIAIKEGIEFDGQQDLRTKVMIALFGLFAEVERDLISERTKEGLAAAKAQGKLLGRPKGALGKSRLDGKEQDIRVLLGKNVSKASIAKILDVSRSALYHFIETRKIVPD